MTLSTYAGSDTLVWLGVGYNADLSCIADETQVVLVDANPSALKTLEKQSVAKSGIKENLTFAPVCLAPRAGETEFYHYNLSEYSALSELTGLRKLFPGIKLKTTQTLTTTPIAEFIRNQTLNNKNNTLRIDIIDQCLPLLRALAQDGLLSIFNHLELQTSTESMYQNAATTSDIVQFLSQQGYELRTQDNSDPDLPKLGFTVNPLWQTLQGTQQQLLEEKKKAEQKEAEQAKALAEKDSKIAEANKIASEAAKQLEIIKAEQAKALAEKDFKIAEANKAASEAAKQLNVIKTEKADQAKVLAEKETKLIEIDKQRVEQKAAKEKQTDALKEVKTQCKVLQTQNRELQIQEKENRVQLEQLKAELLKAEAQITLIRDLFFKNSTFQRPEGQ
ncbi:hypothetical protein [Alteromonas sp. RKMC-009]|uniref:hypothetical protein n=1 Tax=Alteromonas sp. RKMC-009 TaxID=2267264 RepID=UPI000E67BFA9|nr:hypothetical protein [Alteromonas sp. RKMC-009]AYA62995.1 hypothetical protein DS731_02660 [Alteromonas sp. RKMC-009]